MGSALAVVGSAVIGGIASDRASKRAADSQKDAQRINAQAVAQARKDASRLFGEASESRDKAFGNTLKFLSGAPEKQLNPLIGGSNLAQEQVQRGLPQVLNAIMGRPVDLSGFTARSIPTGAEGFNFDLSEFAEKPPAAAPVFKFDPNILKSLGQINFGGPR